MSYQRGFSCADCSDHCGCNHCDVLAASLEGSSALDWGNGWLAVKPYSLI